jgi:hypothetical protein
MYVVKLGKEWKTGGFRHHRTTPRNIPRSPQLRRGYNGSTEVPTENGDVSNLSMSSLEVGGFDPLEDGAVERDFDGGPKKDFGTAVSK